MLLPLSELNREKTDEKILRPFDYINKVPSKYHYAIVMAFNHWLQAPENKVKEIGNILQDIHTVTLIMDDIEDDSKFRYGVPAAHVIHNLGFSINAASTALAITLKRVLALGHPSAVHMYSDALLESHRGQGIELYWRDNFECPTEEEYLDVLKLKAAPFFIFAVQVLQLFSDSKENYLEIATLLGLYYALRDDYCNLFNRGGIVSLADSTTFEGTKIDVNFDSDITDGKYTLPIIHALKYPESASQIKNILKQRTNDRTLIKHCVSILERLGCDKYTQDILRRLETDIHNEINRLGGNPMLTSLIKQLENWRREGEL